MQEVDPEGWCPVAVSGWHGFSALRNSAQASNLHAQPTQGNKSPIQKANHTDLHILEEISAMICSPGAKLLGVLIPTPPSYKSPISFPSSTPTTLASFLFLQHTCKFQPLCSCFPFLVCSSPLLAHLLYFSAQSYLNRKAFLLRPV